MNTNTSFDLLVLKNDSNGALTFGAPPLKKRASVYLPKNIDLDFEGPVLPVFNCTEAGDFTKCIVDGIGNFCFGIKSGREEFPYQLVVSESGRLDSIKFVVNNIGINPILCIKFEANIDSEITINLNLMDKLDQAIEIGLYNKVEGEICKASVGPEIGRYPWSLGSLSISHYIIRQVNSDDETVLTEEPAHRKNQQKLKPGQVIVGEEADLEVGPDIPPQF